MNRLDSDNRECNRCGGCMTMTMTYHLDIFINAKCPTRVKVCGLMSYGVSVRRLTSYGLNVLLCSGATPYRRLMSYI